MTSKADSSSILIGVAAQSGFVVIAVIVSVPNVASVCLRFSMSHLPLPADDVSKSGWRRKVKAATGRAAAPPDTSILARLNPVADRAKTRKGLFPLVARRTADDPHRALAAEAQPLHKRDRRIVPAAGGIDPRLIASHAIDADRLGHRDMP